jgi:dynein assembly factor 3, axonemal
MSAETVAKSMGHHGHWGFSAGFDFLAALPADTIVKGQDEPINILLVQPSDIRHILFTIARRRRHCAFEGQPLPRINFYLLENPVEILARDLLLLQMLTDFEIPIRQRANVFLEIFGNNKVQKRTSEYIELLGKQLKLLCAKGTGRLDNVLDFCLLNYREKDVFENALQAYATSYSFDIDTLYDHRQRGFYEDRFDSRKALYDWTYHASIKAKGSIVHIKQYRQWRHTGLAFEFGDQTYSEPNRTLMTFTEGFIKKGKEKGLKKEVLLVTTANSLQNPMLDFYHFFCRFCR